MAIILKHFVFVSAFLLFLSEGYPQETFPIKDYYPLAHNNEWRYKAPDDWPEGDYVSKVVADESRFTALFEGFTQNNLEPHFSVGEQAKTFKHYDATKAAKLLSIDEEGIFYHGDTFANDGSVIIFESPIPWFSTMESIGSTLVMERKYTRFFKDGTTKNGVFKLQQEIAGREKLETPYGSFEDCLKIVSDTYWDLGEGSEAKSVNTYFYAKDIGVVRASARFILLKEGKEMLNRLIETDMKSYQLF